jgi:hypothetical protein
LAKAEQNVGCRTGVKTLSLAQPKFKIFGSAGGRYRHTADFPPGFRHHETMVSEPRRRNAPAIVILCIGLLFLAATVASLIPTLLFLGHATAAQATFAGSVARPGGRSGSTFYYPRFAFRTLDGQERTLTSSSGSTDQPYQRGQRVTVYYDPQQPDRSTVASFWTLWAGTTFLASFAGMFTGIPALLLLLDARARRIARREVR